MSLVSAVGGIYVIFMLETDGEKLKTHGIISLSVCGSSFTLLVNIYYSLGLSPVFVFKNRQ